MCVHRLDGTVIKFTEHPSGVHVFNPRNVTNNCVNEYTMISTVAKQKKIQAADATRNLYRKIGHPDEAEFQSILRNNFIRNCPVSPDDAKRALIIYGPDIAVIKGKMARSGAAARTPPFVAESIPAPILRHHQNVTLCADFFFVKGHPFYHTISRDIGFCTISPVPDRTKLTILRETQAVIRLYQAMCMPTVSLSAYGRNCDPSHSTLSLRTVTLGKWSGPFGPSRSAFTLVHTVSLLSVYQQSS
jgi:hypothetical protein